ncbi:hypothetical protein [Streptomyces sp. NPDC101150]|uniref:hypothetical protein n=1 Tax=Streptomyces sp. NPDC101150 TaxID=3366114 RepID=UPI0037F1F5A7
MEPPPARIMGHLLAEVVADVTEHHTRAEPGEQPGGLGALTARGTGDDGGLAFECEHGPSHDCRLPGTSAI